MKFFKYSKDVIKVLLKIASIKPLRELAVKLITYWRNDGRYDNNEIVDLFFTLARLFGIHILHDKAEKRITIQYDKKL